MAISKNRLAITADDYGPHPIINAGVIEAAKSGMITSVGVLPNRYDSHERKYNCEAEIEKLIEANDKVGIGVHLSISSGQPLKPHDKLKLENGFFQRIQEFKFGAGKKHLDAMTQEVTAQILEVKRVLDKHGKRIDHVSSHQSLLSLFTPYHDVLLKVLKNLQIKTTVRNPLPISKFKGYKDDFGHSKMKAEGFMRAAAMIDDNIHLVPRILAGISQNQLLKKRDEAMEGGNACPIFLFDNFYGQPSNKEIKLLFDKAFDATDGFEQGEFVVHLGKGDVDNNNVFYQGINTKYFKMRIKELGVLTKSKIFDLAQERGIEICPMGDFE